MNRVKSNFGVRFQPNTEERPVKSIEQAFTDVRGE